MITMIDFTKERWKSDKNSSITSMFDYDILNEHGDLIATVHNGDDDEDTAKIARLIAAAPELYNFVKVASGDRFVDKWAMMAVAKKLLSQIDAVEYEL